MEDRQKMRDRWLHSAFAAGLSTPTSESKSITSNEYQTIIVKNSIDEEEAIRLLIDYGIAEDKAKGRLQVRVLNNDLNGNKRCSLKEIQTGKAEDLRGYFTTEELVQIFKRLSTRTEIYHLLVRCSAIESLRRNH